MLQSIRDHTQGWIAGVIISILILSFALWGVHSYLENGSNNTVAADVNGVEISKREINVAYERMRRQLQMQNSSAYQLSVQAETELKNRALQALINLQVLKQASLDQKYRVASRQVNGFLESMPEFQVNGRFSTERFQRVLETALYNVGEFIDLVRTSLLIDQPRLGLVFTSFALPNEISDTMNLVNQERDISYLMLPFATIAKQPIQLSNEKIQGYYNQHQDEFKTLEQVSVEFIEMPFKDLVAAVNATDEELKKFYTDNLGSYSQPMQLKLESFFIPLKDNATEQEVKQAQAQMSDISQQAKKGKDLQVLTQKVATIKNDPKLQGWVALNTVPSELQKTVSSLTKTGMVSDPVRTPNGLTVIKAVEVKDAVAQPYAQVRDKVKAAYAHQQAEEKFADMRDKLASATYEHPDSLEQAAKSLALPVKTTELFTRTKGGKDISANSQVRDAAFSNDVLTLKNNSDVIQINGEDVVVLRIKQHLPATLLPLNVVEKQITDNLKLVAVKNKTSQLANEIAQQLKKGMSVDQIVRQYNLTWNNVGFTARHASKINLAILDAAFAMPKLASNNSMDFTVAKLPDGYAVVMLKAVRNSANQVDQKQAQAFAEQLQNTQGLMEYELYKQSLLRQAKIEVNS